MRKGRPKVALIPTGEERQRLESFAHRSRSAAALARRARIILACAEGTDSKVVARRLHVTPGTVCKWRGRFSVVCATDQSMAHNAANVAPSLHWCILHRTVASPNRSRAASHAGFLQLSRPKAQESGRLARHSWTETAVPWRISPSEFRHQALGRRPGARRLTSSRSRSLFLHSFASTRSWRSKARSLRFWNICG